MYLPLRRMFLFRQSNHHILGVDSLLTQSVVASQGKLNRRPTYPKIFIPLGFRLKMWNVAFRRIHVISYNGHLFVWRLSCLAPGVYHTFVFLGLKQNINQMITVFRRKTPDIFSE